MTFRVVAYHGPDAPLSYRWKAIIFVPAVRKVKDAAGKVIERHHNAETPLAIYFKGATREAAVTRAENWWHGEKAKEAAREAAAAERREKLRLAKVKV